MTPSLNDIQIHGCLVFHVIPELYTRSALFSGWLKSDAVNGKSKEGRLFKVSLKQIIF
jgi:hypothetical protein